MRGVDALQFLTGGAMNYQLLKAFAALNKEYGDGRIDRATFEKLHAALAASPRQARAAAAATELHRAVETYVKTAFDALAARVARCEMLEQRVAELERKAAPESGLRRIA
jgi:hypothetical protein